MNTEHGPLSDVNLRQARSYAFDYDAMIEVLEYADLMTRPAAPPGCRDTIPRCRSTAPTLRRREALAQSAYPNGGIKLTYVHVSGYDQQRRMGARVPRQRSSSLASSWRSGR
jgi:peptide/nickel transport system substrate-binding protein